MIYASYDYYVEIYNGKVRGEDYGRLAARASAFIDYCTMGRAAAAAGMDEVKMCCCALVDQYDLVNSAQALASKNIGAGISAENGEVQSESVGGWSRTFRSGGDSSAAALKAAENAKTALSGIVQEYLGHTGLLQARGYGSCPCFPTA